jgi:hypothetical protein
MMISVLHWDTGVILQVSRDSANPTEKELRAQIDHMQESYGVCIIKYNILLA